MISKALCSQVDADDSEYYSCDSDMDDDNQLTADAVHTEQPYRLQKHLTLPDIHFIDNNLDLYEKISIVYLLYKTPKTALERIIWLLLKNPNLDVVYEWYCNEKQSTNYESKILEALTIIQNYEILMKLGFEKNDMICRYVPLQETVLDIHPVRKYCYRVCEDFTSLERNKFSQCVKKDFENKGIQYVPKEMEALYANYLEMCFLFFETNNYITLCNVKNLNTIFKQLDLINLADKFEALQKKLSANNNATASAARFREFENYNVDRMPGGLAASASIANELEVLNETPENSIEPKFIYEIDFQRPGLILIINNEDFYTEFRKQYIDKLPKTDMKLETRKGSQIDCDRLEKVFQKLGFGVNIKKNLDHSKMLEVLKTTVKNFDYSTLMVAILSHGDQGVVYGANTIPVEIAEIQKIICDKQLSGKPKVLLLQSCQGSDCQKINDDDDIEIDAPKFIPPKTTDLLTFRATISGYSAVRHRKNGTWFIQAFCNAIETNPSDDIQAICTKVTAEVSAKLWGEKCMVPLVETTFTKLLYLRPTK